MICQKNIAKKMIYLILPIVSLRMSLKRLKKLLPLKDYCSTKTTRILKWAFLVSLRISKQFSSENSQNEQNIFHDSPEPTLC